MEEKMTFKAVNGEGKEVECEVLFTFESDETKKNYIANMKEGRYNMDSKLIENEKDIIFYTDEEGNTKVYASIYNPELENSELLPIESEAEWRIIETILEEIQAEIKGEA